MNPIVGIGELLWDVYPDGRKVAGGAPFNFAFHCRQLGHPAVIVSRVGADHLGRELREEVRRLGLSDEFIQTDPARPTGTVRVTLDANRVPSYTITEDVAWDHIEWNDQLADLAGRYEAICFGTLASRARVAKDDPIPRFLSTPSRVFKPLYPFDPLEPWSPARHQREPRPLNVADLNLRPPFVVDQVVERAIGHSGWYKVSADEMRTLGAKGGEITPRKWYDDMWWEGGPPDIVLIVTDGPHGVTVLHRADEFHEPSPPTRVVDTVGAGDAFTAAMVCLHLEGRPLRECARFATRYAARVCEHQGATPRVDRAGVERDAFGPAGGPP